MPYTVGLSSGIWGAKRGVELLGIPRKIEWAATGGVTFVEVALESITEFEEPEIVEKVNRAKKLGLTFGIHGEAYAMGGHDNMPLASALEADYARAHDRLMLHIGGAQKIGAVYITIHSSESHPFILLGRELQPSRLVDFWGRKLDVFFKENPKILEWLIEQKFIKEMRHVYYAMEHEFEVRAKMAEAQKGAEIDIEKIRKEAYMEGLKKYVISNELDYGIERIAYYAVAKYMQLNNDPIWMDIVGRKLTDDELFNEHKSNIWVPAVAAKYIWGHFRQDLCPSPRTEAPFKEENVKVLLERYKIYFCFETPMGSPGYEIYMRLAKLSHMYAMIKAIGSPWLGLTMDMEHMLGCAIKPEKDIEMLPWNGGAAVKIVHVTVPSPLNPSHLPLPLASDAQLYIYSRLWQLRQKGFKNGWLIFERGGEEGVVKESVLAMRQIAAFLEKDVPPDKLPEEFFGLKPMGPEVKMQEVKIREHALDPLKGVLAIPEEEYTFLSKAALEKGKKYEEWAKERYR
ncbi:MAG: hypothetical protein QW227_02300 [Candidatus Aenigmatarchaeota archaeon]|nr:hypothetical protein [Candidatus Aenigmarchaeota archaeon]